MTRKRSNYRPRHIHADPLRVARNQATTLTDAELAQISGPIHAAFDALRAVVQRLVLHACKEHRREEHHQALLETPKARRQMT